MPQPIFFFAPLRSTSPDSHGSTLSTRIFFSLAFVFWIAACSPDSESPSRGIAVSLRLVQSTEGLPFTEMPDVVLMPNDQACIISSYEFRVECGGKSWVDGLQFGAEGDGPGEFRVPGALLRVSDTEVGVVDWRSGRFSVFNFKTGDFLDSRATSVLFRPLGHPRDNMLAGQITNFQAAVDSIAETRWFDLTSDSSFGRSYRAAFPGEGLAFPRGVRDSDSTVVFQLRGYLLGRFDNSGQLLKSYTSADYESELMTPRELEEWADGLFRFSGGQAIPQSQIDERAALPKQPVVLVERPNTVEGGLHPFGLDWYDIVN